MPALNCKPGELARIVGTHPALGINDKIVQLADQPATFDAVFNVWEWQLEQPIDVKPLHRIKCVQSGQILEVGEVGEVSHVPDFMLRPIRDPGSDAVDEMVQRVGPAPMTLTEILQGVAHG